MTAIISRIVTAGVLMVWGTVLTWFYFSGQVKSYLHPSFCIYPAIAGIILILMAATVLIFGFPECCNEENCMHTHGKFNFRRILTFVVLVLPIFIATAGSPGQFSAVTVMNRGYIEDVTQLPGARRQAFSSAYAEPPLPGETPSDASSSEPVSADTYMKKNEKGQVVIQTIDLMYAAEEPSMRKDFSGREVEVMGQFMPAKVKNPTGKNFDLVRMYVNCCAADARPMALTVEANQPEDFKKMTWLKVTGKAVFRRDGDRYTPLVVADSIVPCDAPDEKFLY